MLLLQRGRVSVNGHNLPASEHATGNPALPPRCPAALGARPALGVARQTPPSPHTLLGCVAPQLSLPTSAGLPRSPPLSSGQEGTKQATEHEEGRAEILRRPQFVLERATSPEIPTCGRLSDGPAWELVCSEGEGSGPLFQRTGSAGARPQHEPPSCGARVFTAVRLPRSLWLMPCENTSKNVSPAPSPPTR